MHGAEILQSRRVKCIPESVSRQTCLTSRAAPLRARSGTAAIRTVSPDRIRVASRVARSALRTRKDPVPRVLETTRPVWYAPESMDHLEADEAPLVRRWRSAARKISLPWALRRTSRGLLATARPDGLAAYAQSLLVVGLCTALAWQTWPYLRSGNLLMIYLMGTVVVATRFGRGPSIVAALSSVAAFDLLFVPPFNFALADVEYLLTFAVLLAVALVISSRSARLREHAAAVREYERKTAALREAARAVQVAQLQGLTAAALAIGSTLSVEEALRVLAERARGIVGAHLSIARLVLNDDASHALNAVSASDDYAAWRDASERAAEVYGWVRQLRRPLRITQ